MNDTRSIVVLQLVSFLTFTIGHSVQSGSASAQIPEARSLLGWAMLSIILLVANDLGTTQELARAMAWLIFISVMLYYGVDLFNQLGKMVAPKDTATSNLTRINGKLIPLE